MGLILSFLAIVLLVAADQGIKIWAITVLQEKGTMPFLHIGNWKLFDLTYLENSGAVFGSFHKVGCDILNRLSLDRRGGFTG